MIIALADAQGNIVTNQNGAKLTVRIDSDYSSDSEGIYSPIIEGTTQFDSFGGTFVVSEIEFAGTPGLSYKILF